MAFRGQYSHSIDAKGRTILPIQFREKLEKGFIITRGLDPCLYIYDSASWENLEKQGENLPTADPVVRKFIRSFFGAARECEFDGNGRAIIPKNLLEYAGIGDGDKDVVTLGVPGHIELWRKETLAACDSDEERVTDDDARYIAGFGFKL